MLSNNGGGVLITLITTYAVEQLHMTGIRFQLIGIVVLLVGMPACYLYARLTSRGHLGFKGAWLIVMTLFSGIFILGPWVASEPDSWCAATSLRDSPHPPVTESCSPHARPWMLCSVPHVTLGLIPHAPCAPSLTPCVHAFSWACRWLLLVLGGLFGSFALGWYYSNNWASFLHVTPPGQAAQYIGLHTFASNIFFWAQPAIYVRRHCPWHSRHPCGHSARCTRCLPRALPTTRKGLLSRALLSWLRWASCR